MTDQGVILVGEAAKSWVRLQWIDSILGWIIVWGIIVLIGLFIYGAVQGVREEQREKKS